MERMRGASRHSIGRRGSGWKLQQEKKSSMSAKSLMVMGTASDVGKSVVVTALCRALTRAGMRVAPFKSQNMSNNAAVCPGGGEIGRAQAVQAEACGLEPTVDMNPVLLKPESEIGCQVVIRGQARFHMHAHEPQRPTRESRCGLRASAIHFPIAVCRRETC